MIYPGFIGEAYRSQSRAAAGDLLINLYTEKLEVGEGGIEAVFYGTPGTALFSQIPEKGVRGMVSLDSLALAVVGTSCYQINADGTYAKLGDSVFKGTGPVSIQTDGKGIAVSAGGTLWTFLIGKTVAWQDQSAIVPSAGMISYSDGYFIVNVPGTQQFFISGLFDVTSWYGLDFGAKSGFADIVVGQICDHRELWLLGSRTTEVFWNSGNPNFPWERIQGPFVEAGLGAIESLAQMDNTIFWLHSDKRGSRMIWKANGYTPQRVSTFALESAMNGYARVDDAIAYTYQELGHTFYVITFPSAVIPGFNERWGQGGLAWDQPGAVWDAGGSTNARSVTWVFDASTSQWHQRDYLDPQFGISMGVRGRCHMFAFGRHLVGDFENGNIYDQSVNYYSDAFNTLTPGVNRIRRLRRAPHVLKEHRRISYPGFELHLQQGVVPQAGAGSAPVFNLRKSRDGGFTWSGYLEAQAALAGQYRQRLIWRRLGDAIDPVIEVSSDEPIQHAWIAAYLNPEPVVSDR
jgi:hypothetical protein